MVYQLVLHNDEDVVELKRLLMTGPTLYSCCSYTFQCMSDGAALFGFNSLKDLNSVAEAGEKMGLKITKQIDENSDNLGKLVADTLANNSKHAPRKQIERPKTPQEKARDDLAQDLDAAMQRDPSLKRKIEQNTKKLGLTRESRLDPVVRSIIQVHLDEGLSLNESIRLAQTFWGGDVVVESVIDDISTQMLEYFVTLKAQGIKDIPLSKLVKAVQGNPLIDLNPTQDMALFVNLLKSLPTVDSVDIKNDRVILEMPPKPGEEDEDEDNVDDVDTPKKDPVEKKAQKQATKSIRSSQKAPQGAIDAISKGSNSNRLGQEVNLFASQEFNLDALNEMEQPLTGELAEKLADILDSLNWNETNETLIQELASKICKDYPLVSIEDLVSETKTFFKQFYGAK